MRLARYLAKAGVASRRHCETFIAAGRVSVNGEIVRTPATNVRPGHDKVSFDGKPVTVDAHAYYLLNKPPGYTCTAHDPHASHKALDLIDLPDDLRLFSVGRLDKESEGLLLFTNDGELAHRLTHPSFQIVKTYLVWVSGTLHEAWLTQLLQGIEEGGEILKAISATVRQREAGRHLLEIAVAEGKNREIRRMCGWLGLTVIRLVRIRFGPIELGSFPTGDFRPLRAAEVQALRAAAGLEC